MSQEERRELDDRLGRETERSRGHQGFKTWFGLLTGEEAWQVWLEWWWELGGMLTRQRWLSREVRAGDSHLGIMGLEMVISHAGELAGGALGFR